MVQGKVTIGKKQYTLYDTMLVEEYENTMALSQVSLDIGAAIQSGESADITKIMPQLQKMKIDDWKNLKSVIKRCFRLPDAEMKKMHYVDLLVLFTELLTESSQIKKKSSTE